MNRPRSSLLSDLNLESARPIHKPPSFLARLGRALVNFLGVVVIGIAAAAIFAALGLGLVYGARAAGITLPGMPQPPTPTPTPFLTPTPLPERTAVPGCPDAAAWWEAQRENFDYFLILSDQPPADQTASLLQVMRIKRDFSANVTASACLDSARTALLTAFDARIGAYDAIASGGAVPPLGFDDRPFVDVTRALWAHDVATYPNAAPALTIPEFGGAGCEVGAWYAAVGPHWDAFQSTLAQVDLNTQPPNRITQLISEMQATRGNLAQITPPSCAEPAQTLMLTLIDLHANLFTQALQGGIEPTNIAFAQIRRDRVRLDAWLEWLGV